MAQRNGPLDGVLVIELAHVMAGPTCGRMLADMGAEVIKLERIPGGDDTRRDRIAGEPEDGESHAFMMMNRNKRGIAVDLKSEGGEKVLRRLLEKADVLVENYRHDTMEKLGFGFEQLRDEYPRLVYCAVSGFGRTGPYATRGGFDLVAQGMSGIMSFTGEGEGRPPVKVGAPVTDITAGILAALGVVSALYNRTITGRGQMVDASLFEAGITFTYWHSAICIATGQSPGALGSRHPLNAPYQAFETADGWINIGAANQANWKRMLRVLDAPHLAEDPRFATNSDRLVNVDALDEVLTPVFRERPTADWLRLLDEAGVPAGPILTVAEMHRDPQALARGMIPSVRHSSRGDVKTIGFPVRFSDTPATIRKGAPRFGEDTVEVLRSAGFDGDEIDQLLASGAVGTCGK